MKKILLGLISLVAVVVLYSLLTRCKEPDGMQVLMIQLRCARSIDLEAFRVDACKTIHGTPDCQFVPEDEATVKEMFFKIVNDCADAELKSKNLCTDKVEKLQ